MYSYIRGRLEEISEDGIVVDNHGIGYQIYVPANMADRLPPRGEEVKIYTYLSVKEDDMSLFGFLTKDDLLTFRLLLGVGGIGPKGALGILSVMSADDLRFAVLGGDAKAISKAPGIGAKTAQRVILELKDKLKLEDVLTQEEQARPDVPQTGVKNEVVQALMALGYSSSEAFAAVSKVEIDEGTDVEDVLKQVLKQMAFM